MTARRVPALRKSDHFWLASGKTWPRFWGVGSVRVHFLPTYIRIIAPCYPRSISYQFLPHPPAMSGHATPSSMLSEAPHPFYPIGVEIAGYLANDKDTVTLIGIALAGLAVICSATWTIVSAVSRGLRTRDKLTILWFMSSRLLPQNVPCSS
jgi:hypothetical protein